MERENIRQIDSECNDERKQIHTDGVLEIEFWKLKLVQPSRAGIV